MSAEFLTHLNQLSENHPDWMLRFWGDDEVNSFMTTFCTNEEFDAFFCLNRKYGPAVADMFRYKLMQVHGGVYIDIKSGWKSMETLRRMGHLPPLIFCHWG